MRFLFFSNLYIAAASALFTHATYYRIGVEPHYSPLLLLVFFATLLVYNLDRISGMSEEDEVEASKRHRWIADRRTTLWAAAGVSGVGLCVSLFFVHPKVLLALLPLGLASVAYSIPLIRRGAERLRLKDIAGLKIFVISAVWAGATAFLPAFAALEDPWTTDVLAVVVERALFIFAITLPFDVRDMERDRASSIRTIPLMIGARWTRWLAIGLMTLYAGIVLTHYGGEPGSPTFPLLGTAGLAAVVLAFSHEKRSELYYVGVLDGLMIVQAASLQLSAFS